MDVSAFREKVLAILREEFPLEPFARGEREDVVQWKETEVSLQSLWTEFSDAEHDVLKQTITDHFGRVLKMFLDTGHIIPESWDEAQPRVRLQLMPAAFRKPDFSVTYPFLDDVLVSVVVDAEHGYAFVRAEDLVRWNTNAIDLYEIARDNLEAASRDLDLSYVAGPPSLMALGSQDGYDAARLLLPRLREFAIERLGSPFLAGIPNRDFLIMWSEDSPSEFSDSIRQQLVTDSRSRSHPLTSRVLVVTEETIRPE